MWGLQWEIEGQFASNRQIPLTSESAFGQMRVLNEATCGSDSRSKSV